MESNKHLSIDKFVPTAKDELSDMVKCGSKLAAYQEELESLLDKTIERADRVAIVSILIQKNLNEIQNQLKLMSELAHLNITKSQQNLKN